MKILQEKKENHYKNKQEDGPAPMAESNNPSLPKPIQRPSIDPDSKREIEKVYDDIWQGYDENYGYVKKEKYKQIMNFVKLYKKIPEKNKEFSEANLEAAFNKEENTVYVGEERRAG